MPAFRNTIQKDTVMGVLRREQKHLTAEQVFSIVSKESLISRSTVFRILNQLSDRGDILRIRVPDGADFFDYHTHPHYHVKCVSCGEVFDVDMPVMEHLEENIANTHGFKFIGHSIIFSGLCPKCGHNQSV